MRKRTFNCPLFALSVTLVILLLSFFYPEWHYPCVPLEDGSIPVMYGFPLPFISRGVSSLHWESMPHIFILNVLLLTFVVYILLRALLPQQLWSQRWLKWSSFSACIIVVSLYLLSTWWQVNNDWLTFRVNAAFNHGTDTGYFDLRPVGMPFLNPAHCPDISNKKSLFLSTRCF